ncbi:MAG: STT3 domain-containing protein [Candidatus Omnitrophota bacterium]
MKKNKLLIFSLLLTLAVGLNVYFRSFTINFPQIKKQAHNFIEQAASQQIMQDVYRRFPQFDPLAKEKIAKTRLAEYKKQNKQEINKRAKELYIKLKDKFQDDTGQTYIMELDCWHWARYTENIVRTGHPGDEQIYGRQWDLLMLAPLGSYMNWDHFLYHLSASLYKIFNFFHPVKLHSFLFYLPLLFTAVFIVILYMFVYRSAGNIGALTAVFFIGLSPIFIPRSCAGWFDKDILSLLFPVLIIWVYLTALNAKSLRQRLLLICFSSFWVGVFCFAWMFWWFVFLIILAYETISLLYLGYLYFYRNEKDTALLKQHAISVSSFIFFSFFWILVIVGKEPLAVLYNFIIQALILNKPLLASVWPNVYSTVGELKKIGLREAAGSLGGWGLALPALVWMVILTIRAFSSRKFSGIKREAVIIMAIWLVAMLVAVSRGVRFMVFLLIPLGISLAWLVSDAYAYISRKHKAIAGIFALAALTLIGSIFVNRAYRAASSMYPLIDDSWYKILNMIKEKTSQETILNSWWDYGDWFKVIGKRRVIFDGQSQDMPQAYWMGKALLSNNENEAVAILRMLNNGGNKAFEIINDYVKDPLKSVLLLESILGQEPSKAQKVLLEYLPVVKANEVMRLLFAIPARACFIVDNTMVFKMPAISYLGSWNFAKVYIAQNLNKEEKGQIIERLKKLGWKDQDLQRFYQEAFLISTKNIDEWLSRRLQFYGPPASGREKDGVIFFENGFVYNPKAQTVIQSSAGQIPMSLFLAKETSLAETPLPNANVGFSALIFDTPEGYKCVLLDRPLAASLFSRLYFLKGRGMKHFIPFIDAEEGNNYVRVFNIAW